MDTLNTVLITILTLGILVTIHEFGHYWVARRCGVKVLCFSVGFGPKLLSRTGKDGTVYQLAIIPLGGYVKMLDQREGDVAAKDLPYAFNQKSVAQRFAIVAAGPIANFLLAIVAFWFVFSSGVTEVKPWVGGVTKDSVAQRAGLNIDDEILAVDGESTPSWQAVSMQLLNRIGESGDLALSVAHVEGGNERELTLKLDQWLGDAEALDLIASLGIEPYRPSVRPLIDKVLPDSAAAEAGIEVGDLLVSAQGQSIADWHQWVELVRANPDQSLEIELERDHSLVSLLLTPRAQTGEDGSTVGLAGVGVKQPELPPEFLRTVTYTPFAALGAALNKTWKLSVFTLDSIKKMLIGLISPKNLSGPITIAKVASSSASYGLIAYISFLALLSISLGVLNLLPIPVLDGGHLFFYAIEWIKGSPLSDAVQDVAMRAGMSMIMMIMILAIYNDIARL